MSWRLMSSAPRDGRVIEIKNSFGLKPTYGLFMWDDSGPKPGWWMQVSERPDPTALPPGMVGVMPFTIKNMPVGSSVTISLRDCPIGLDDKNAASLSWRPYVGEIKDYVDPTRGEQFKNRYWRPSFWQRLWA